MAQPKFIAANQSLHDRLQTHSTTPEQPPLIARTDLEEKTAQLAQQRFSTFPNQALIQFLSLLPKFEYEMKKRTFFNGLQSDREQGTNPHVDPFAV